MKKIALLFIAFSSQWVMAQSTEISAKYDKIGKFSNGYASVTKNRLVGVINTEGKEIIPPSYDHISSFMKDGKAFTRKNGLVGVIDNTGKVIIENKYEYISHFKGDNAVVRKDGLCGVINKNGKIIVDMKYQKLKVEDGGIIKAVNPDKTEVLIKPNN